MPMDCLDPTAHRRAFVRLASGLGIALALSTAVDAQTWSQAGPAPRYHSSSVYDAATDQMIVFGGQPLTGAPLNDVWSEQQVVSAGQASHVAANWVQVSPTGTAPSARFGHSAIYDSSSNRMVVFGGGTSSSSCLNDLWILDDANSSLGPPAWLAETARGTLPQRRMNSSSVYDPTTNTLILFGGTNCSGGYLSDVWTL